MSSERTGEYRRKQVHTCPVTPQSPSRAARVRIARSRSRLQVALNQRLRPMALDRKPVAFANRPEHVTAFGDWPCLARPCERTSVQTATSTYSWSSNQAERQAWRSSRCRTTLAVVRLLEIIGEAATRVSR